MTAIEGVPASARGEGRQWLRAAGLFGLVLATVVFAPRVLIGIPFIMLVLGLPRTRGLGVVIAAMATLLVLAAPTNEGTMSWQLRPLDGFIGLERAWAVLLGGWFVAITWRWPDARFTKRGLGAVAAAAGLVAAYFAVNVETWGFVDWFIRSRLGGDTASIIESLRQLTNVDPDLLVRVQEMMRVQMDLYPSLIALSSFAGLGVAWWLYVLVSHGRTNGLGALRHFAFPDWLVWVVIAGIGLVLVGSAWASTVGYNALFFMGALYALRGLAVFLFFKGGVTWVGALLGFLVTLLVAPLVIGLAVMVGLGDTWLGLRANDDDSLADANG